MDFLKLILSDPQILSNLMTVVVTPFILWLISFIGKWAREKTDKEKFSRIIYTLENVARTVVASIEETVAKEVKEAAKDGKITKEEAQKLKKLAVERVMYSLSEKTLDEASQYIDDVEQFIGDIIEKQLVFLKSYKKRIQNMVGVGLEKGLKEAKKSLDKRKKNK